jgi:hypothetical protein
MFIYVFFHPRVLCALHSSIFLILSILVISEERHQLVAKRLVFLTKRLGVLLEKILVAQLLKKFRLCFGTEDLLKCSQKPATRHYSISGPHPPTVSLLRFISMLFSLPRLPRCLFLQYLRPKFCMHMIFHMLATCTSYPIMFIYIWVTLIPN